MKRGILKLQGFILISNKQLVPQLVQSLAIDINVVGLISTLGSIDETDDFSSISTVATVTVN